MLAQNAESLRAHAVKALFVFGSVARGEAGDESDIDVLVDFDESQSIGLFEFVRLQRFLSEILQRRVDLATREALRPQMREQILKEAIRAA